MARQPGDAAPELTKDEARQGGGDRKVDGGLPIVGPVIALAILAVAGVIVFL